jgi:hypothetical protein
MRSECMCFQFNADGEIHALSKDWAYILRYLDREFFPGEEQHVKSEYMQKYCDYLEKNGMMEGEKTHQFIVRDAYAWDPLGQKMSIALKFKRGESDGLG